MPDLDIQEASKTQQRTFRWQEAQSKELKSILWEMDLSCATMDYLTQRIKSRKTLLEIIIFLESLGKYTDALGFLIDQYDFFGEPLPGELFFNYEKSMYLEEK